MTIKQPPSDSTAEEAMLGCLLIDSEILAEFYVQSELNWFYTNENYKIAKAIFTLALDWEAVDLVSVKSALEKAGKLESIWGLTKLVELTENASSYNWRTYSSILQKLYQKRELIKESQKLLNSCYGEEPMESVVEKGFSNINSLLSSGTSSATDMEDNILLLEKYIENNNTKNLIWYSWGNDWLDSYTQWIRKGKTYRIGAPSGV